MLFHLNYNKFMFILCKQSYKDNSSNMFLFVCLFVNSSKTAKLYEQKLRGMISHRVQVGLGLQKTSEFGQLFAGKQNMQ